MRIQSKAKVKYHSDETDIQVHLAQHHPQITVVKEKNHKDLAE